MPLNTQIIRDGTALTFPWGQFHVAAMFLAAAIEDDGIHKDYRPNDDLDYPNEAQPINPSDVFTITNYVMLGTIDWPYTLKQDHKFEDCADGEVFELKAGDVLHMNRVMK